MHKLIKKLTPYFFVILVLAGLFGPTVRVDAQTAGNCSLGASYTYQGACVAAGGRWTPTAKPAPVPCTGVDTSTGNPTPAGCTPTSASSTAENAFQREIDNGCGVSPTTWFNGCILKVFYYTYFQLPALILLLVAQFFNAMVNLGIQSSVTASSGFIPSAWAVVRDLSNIFFILVLLYVAIQTILGLSHETKKVIVRVIIMALLINFSMFMSKVVIDSSNILALVFYNKLQTNEARPVDPSRPAGEKDISGDMWRTFDATRLIGPETIEKLKTTTVDGKTVKEKNLPFALTFGIMFIAGSIMLWAAYAFFIAGLMFIGRLIELWVLIIFSPFAFMSWTIPLLSGTPYIGWDEWSKKLIATSFMAPIFMFFIYLIFKLLPFVSAIGGGNTTTWLGTVMQILIPAIVVMALLLKATEFAKKGGGQFGELIMKGGKMLGGLALGAASGGTALALRAGLGGLAMRTAADETLKAKAASGDKGAQRKLALANWGATKSFDFRQSGVGKFVGDKTGIDIKKGPAFLGTEKFEGGRKAQDKKKAEDWEKKFKTYQLSPAEAEKQNKRADEAEEQNKRADEADKQNKRAEDYEYDKKLAQRHAEQEGYEFKETDFKKDYVDGENLSRYGIEKRIEAGSVDRVEKIEKVEKVKTADEVNGDRRKAFANQLTNPVKEEGRAAVKGFFEEWAKGMAGAAKGTLVAGALTGGVAIPVVAGATFVSALKSVLKPKVENPNLVAMIRKGVKDDKEQAWEHLKHAMDGDHHGGDHDKKQGGEGHGHEAHAQAPAAHAPAPAAHPPAGGGHDDHGHAH